MIFEHGLHCSIMFWLNLSILIATMGGEWCMPAAPEFVITAGQDDEPLSQFDRGSSADERSDLRHLRRWQKEMEVDSSTGRPAASPTTKPTVPWRSRFSPGFLRRRPNDIDKRPAARRRVTHRPKDIGGADTPEQVTSYDYIDSGSPKTAKSSVAKSTATKSTVAARILFSTEDECVSANKGRACVCFMTDFLDLIVQRLDETVDDEDDAAAAVPLNCHSFKSVPTAFLVYPVAAAGGLSGTTASTMAAVPATVSADVVVERNGGKSGGGRGRGGVGVHVEKKAADVPAVPSWKEVDFDDVVNYRLEKSSDDHYAVQYGLVGNDAKVPCVINGNGTKMNAFKWDFKKDKHKTNSTVVGTDTNILLILGLEPGDSKNYTCIPKMVGDSKNGTSYKHYVVVISKLSLIDTNFEPDSSRMNLKKFVSCTPGFGIREVFCAACPPHHYSPDKSIECLKCVKGFHQPVAGSEKCIKCRNIFSSGCYVKEVSPKIYYVTCLACLLVCSILAISCVFCCREENEKSIRIIPRKIRKKFKKTKKYSVLSSSQTEDTPDSISSVIKKKTGKLKNLLKFKKKSKPKIVDSKIKFNTVHEKFGERIQNDHVTSENSTTD
ncbi:unnamed protein product [Aphis gossypii]|uniref:Ig-like domain-containing protein n=1 Tax=Aphis gossypii TaxID=80765 RepID=A0A9P0JEG0_APHGO|nr:unnamed protein product [Aphis gossypii]